MPSTYSLAGIIPIEDPVISGVYPLEPDFDVTRRLGNNYIVHKISLKKEQRIRKTFNTNSWVLSHETLTAAELQLLVDFYDDHKYPWQLFYFYDPHETQYLGGAVDLTGASTIGRYTVRFADTQLSHEAVRHHLFSGTLEIVEVNTSTTPVVCHGGWSYLSDRYPSDTQGGAQVLAWYTKAELTGDRDIVPLIVFVPTISPDAPPSYTFGVSDRLADVLSTFGPSSPVFFSGVYQPRLLDWEITQEIDSGDTVRIVLDDADHIFSDYAQQISLDRAGVRFFVYKNNPFGGQGFHNLWQGYVTTWTWNRADGTFIIDCEGGLHGLKRSMPRRSGATVCPWQFNDGFECPYATAGSGGDPDSCDKGLDTPNGCTAHGMTNYFGGVNPKPITISGKLNDTGFAGLMRKGYTSTSTPIKSIQSEVIPLVYGTGRQIVPATIFETRDESEFFVAAGIVSEGQIRSIGQVLLDGQTMHPGYSPIIAQGTIGQNIGTHIDPAFRSSHTCFVSVRRVDEVGFKNPNDTHSILVEVKEGLWGTGIWWWTGPFANASDFPTNCPPCIALNFVLRAMGIQHPQYNPDLLKDTVVEIERFIQCVNHCETLVPSLTGGADEKRYEFRGVVKDLKPAIEHLRDILASAPIDLVYTVGKVSFKIRKDDITNPPPLQLTFEHLENIIQGSFTSSRREPRFNELKILFSDIALDFQENSITVYDEQAQIRSGILFNSSSHQGEKKPHVKQAQMNAIGLFNKSQVIRLATQLLREELGGATEQEQLDARDVSFTAPLIGISVEIGDIISVVHPELPNGQAYVRLKRWQFTSNWDVQLSGSTVTASMYDGLPDQIASDSSGDSVPGIPGGSQGSGPGINATSALLPPVISQISIDYRSAVVGVDCTPE